ncbi:ABC transporter permease [Terriglobus albidus]|uniref:ABC transporter permease n=1 Tax=Terriglobus albidus TaxID=1592106 RepID=UPI0021DF5E05|nr:ABC transporter permease [Terriglobus albidus]
MSWRRFFRRKRSDSELQQEIRAYVEAETEENVAQGMPPDEARRRAHIKFGNSQRIREKLWQQNTVAAIDHLWRDLTYAARTLKRTPGFTTIAVLVMALGIGANVALFTVVRHVLLNPLPFSNPNQLVALDERSHSGKTDSVAAGDFYDWQSASHGFQQMAIWRWSGYNISGDRNELPEFLPAMTCSWNLFTTLGVQPAVGRLFVAADDTDQGGLTVVLSWNLFKRRFNADPSILGKTIRLNTFSYTVIGVLPQSFSFPDPKVQLWIPYHKGTPSVIQHSHYSHSAHVLARLKPGYSSSQAVQEVQAIQKGIFTRFSGTGPVSSEVVSQPLIDDVVGDTKAPLYLLMAAVSCLLLIACLNLSNLLVARAVARRREMAVRSALGGSRIRLICQQITECILICTAGGILGIVLAHEAVRWLTTYWLNLPRAEAIHIDAIVLAFALGVTAFAGAVSGILPALLFTDANVSTALQDSARTAGSSASKASLRKGLMTVEFGITVVLLICAGLLFKSFLQLGAVDLGCTTRNVLTMRYFLRGQTYSKPDQVVSFQQQLLDRVRNLPGVAAAGMTNAVPGEGPYGEMTFTIPEHPPQPPEKHDSALFRTADPGYFQALQIPLLAGRFFTSAERLNNSSFVIINQKLAHEFFPNEDPLGKHLAVSWRSPSAEKLEIVGIVGDTRHRLNESVQSMMWFPILSGAPGITAETALVVRSTTDPAPLSIPIQKAIASVDPDLPVSNVLTMQEVLGRSIANSSFETSLLGAFAALSLLLASIGLFGVLSYLVAQRTSEIGIRIALGARREQVLRLILTDGLRPALVGLALGLCISAAVTRKIQSQLYGTHPLDPVVFGLVAIVLLLVAVAACTVPAWRASRLDPIRALRIE